MGFLLERVIYSHNINHQETDVPIDISIKIVFSRVMNENTLNASNVILRKQSTQEIIDCEYNWSKSNKTLTITPDDYLDPITVYNVELIGSSDSDGNGYDGIKDFFGNIMMQNYSFSFTTSTLTQIDPPVLTSPDNHTSVSSGTQISFSWRSVDDADHYDIQVCKNETFRNIYWPSAPGDYDPFATTVVPDIPFTTNVQYWWRVRSVDASDNHSEWSNVYTFFYGSPQENYVSPEDVPIEGVQILEPLSIFNLKPSARMSNVPLTRLGNIQIIVDGEVSSQYITNDRIYVYSESIDGHEYFTEQRTGASNDNYTYLPAESSNDYFPDDAADKYSYTGVSGEMEATLSSSYDGRYTTITITPTNEDYYRTNNRYFVTVNIPGLQGFYWFTSRYEPMFSTINRIRSSAMGLLNDVDDDVINYTIRYKSLDAIEQAIQTEYRKRENIWLIDHECPFDVYNPPRYVREYVTWCTICDILNTKILEIKVSGDVDKELGDLSISRSIPSSYVTADKSVIFEFEKKREYYDNWIKGHTDPKWSEPRIARRDNTKFRINRGYIGPDWYVRTKNLRWPWR